MWAADTIPGLPLWVPAVLTGIGTIIAAIASGKILVPAFAYQREKDRADKADAEVTRLNAAMLDKMAPALADSSAAIKSSNEVMRDALAALNRRRA